MSFSFVINNPNARKRASLIQLMKIKKSEICIINYKLLTPFQCHGEFSMLPLPTKATTPLLVRFLPLGVILEQTFGLLIVTTRPYNFFQVWRGDITEVRGPRCFLCKLESKDGF